METSVFSSDGTAIQINSDPIGSQFGSDVAVLANGGFVISWSNDIPGAIDHGLFLNEADEILIERDSGTIEKRVREG